MVGWSARVYASLLRSFAYEMLHTALTAVAIIPSRALKQNTPPRQQPQASPSIWMDVCAQLPVVWCLWKWLAMRRLWVVGVCFHLVHSGIIIMHAASPGSPFAMAISALAATVILPVSWPPPPNQVTAVVLAVFILIQPTDRRTYSPSTLMDIIQHSLEAQVCTRVITRRQWSTM